MPAILTSFCGPGAMGFTCLVVAPPEMFAVRLGSQFFERLGKLKFDAVVLFISAGGVNPNDCYDHVSYGRTFATSRSPDFFLDEIVGLRVTRSKLVLKPTNRLPRSQDLLGPLEIQPAEIKAPVGGPEAAPKNVIESIEVAAPLNSRNHSRGNLTPKSVQAIEAGAVDFDRGLRHPCVSACGRVSHDFILRRFLFPVTGFAFSSVTSAESHPWLRGSLAVAYNLTFRESQMRSWRNWQTH